MTVSIRHIKDVAVHKCKTCGYTKMGESWVICPMCAAQKLPARKRMSVEKRLIELMVNSQHRLAVLEQESLRADGYLWFVLRAYSGLIRLTVEDKLDPKGPDVWGYARWPWKGSKPDAALFKVDLLRGMPESFGDAVTHLDVVFGGGK